MRRKNARSTDATGGGHLAGARGPSALLPASVARRHPVASIPALLLVAAAVRARPDCRRPSRWLRLKIHRLRFQHGREGIQRWLTQDYWWLTLHWLRHHWVNHHWVNRRKRDALRAPGGGSSADGAGSTVAVAARRNCCAARYNPNANSSAVCKRWSGSFFNARATNCSSSSGTWGSNCRNGVGSLCTISRAMTLGSAENGYFPEANSYSISP